MLTRIKYIISKVYLMFTEFFTTNFSIFKNNFWKWNLSVVLYILLLLQNKCSVSKCTSKIMIVNPKTSCYAIWWYIQSKYENKNSRKHVDRDTSKRKYLLMYTYYNIDKNIWKWRNLRKMYIFLPLKVYHSLPDRCTDFMVEFLYTHIILPTCKEGMIFF